VFYMRRKYHLIEGEIFSDRGKISDVVCNRVLRVKNQQENKQGNKDEDVV
jgi:hypothetical protein